MKYKDRVVVVPHVIHQDYQPLPGWQVLTDGRPAGVWTRLRWARAARRREIRQLRRRERQGWLRARPV